MSIYEACARIGTALAGISAPQTPNIVRVLPPGHDDDRHAPNAAGCWINVTPVGEAHEDEVNASDLVAYTCRVSAWYARSQRSTTTMAQELGTLGASVVAALAHDTLGGWTRYAIPYADLGRLEYGDGGGGPDLAYVVRCDVTVRKQL